MLVVQWAVCVVKGSPISVHSVVPALPRLPLARCKEEMDIKHLNTVSNTTFSSLLVPFLLRSEPEPSKCLRRLHWYGSHFGPYSRCNPFKDSNKWDFGLIVSTYLLITALFQRSLGIGSQRRVTLLLNPRAHYQSSTAYQK